MMFSLMYYLSFFKRVVEEEEKTSQQNWFALRQQLHSTVCEVFSLRSAFCSIAVCLVFGVSSIAACLVFRVQWSPQCELQHLATSCCSKNMICAKLTAMNAAHICAVNNVQFNVQWGNTTSIAKHSLLPSKNTLLPQNLRVRCEAGVLCTLNILGNQCEVSQPVWHSAQLHYTECALHTECAVSHADFIVASNAAKWKVGGGARCITATRLNGCTAGCTAAGGAECPLQSAREATYTAAAQQIHSALAVTVLCTGCKSLLHRRLHQTTPNNELPAKSSMELFL